MKIKNHLEIAEVCLDSYREIGRFTSILTNPIELTQDNALFIYGNIGSAYVATFPGTRNWTDVLTDISKWGKKLDILGRHQGFSTEFDTIYPKIKLTLPRDKSTPLIFTAHSKGAAMARYLAIECVKKGYIDIELITFGEPKCLTSIDPSINKRIKTTRYVYGYDPIPRLGWFKLKHNDPATNIGPKRRWWAVWDWGRFKHIIHHKMGTYRDALK